MNIIYDINNKLKNKTIIFIKTFKKKQSLSIITNWSGLYISYICINPSRYVSFIAIIVFIGLAVRNFDDVLE